MKSKKELMAKLRTDRDGVWVTMHLVLDGESNEIGRIHQNVLESSPTAFESWLGIFKQLISDLVAGVDETSTVLFENTSVDRRTYGPEDPAKATGVEKVERKAVSFIFQMEHLLKEVHGGDHAAVCVVLSSVGGGGIMTNVNDTDVAALILKDASEKMLAERSEGKVN